MTQTIEQLTKKCFDLKVKNAEKRKVYCAKTAAQFSLDSFFSMHRRASNEELLQLLEWEIEDTILAGKQLDERIANE
jgi:hypothetical protein